MLVLSRKCGQEIVIDDSIRVKVIEVRGNCVRLGILAPLDVPVHRQEIYVKLQEQTAGQPGLSGRASSNAVAVPQ